MGGSKQSNKSSSEPSTANRATTTFSAMSKTQEKSYNRALEGQYQRAFDFTRTSRGRGLGYDPNLDPENKIFFIDKGSKSTKL